MEENKRRLNDYEAVFNPVAWQAIALTTVCNNHPPVSVFLTSRQIGKTSLIKSLMYNFLVGQPNTEILYFATTLTQCNELMFKKLVDANPPLFKKNVIEKCNRQNRILELKNGSRVICAGKENINSFRGYTSDVVFVDEAQEFTDECLEIIMPILAAKKGKLILCGTVRSANDFLYQMYVKAKKTANWLALKVPITSPLCKGLPTATKENIDLQKSILSEAAFRSEWMCEPIVLSGVVYPSFNITNHVKDHIPIDKHLPLHIGVDFNISQMSALICQKKDQTLFIIDEIVQDFENSNTLSLIQEIKRRYGTTAQPKYCSGIILHPDASGRNRDASHTNYDATNHSQLRGGGYALKFPPQGNPPIIDSTIIVNGRLLNANNEVNLFVSRKKCPNTIKTLSLLVWDKQGKQHDKQNNLDHLSDCLRYVCWNLFRNKNVIRSTNFT